jgi:hypothetical protein
MVGRFRHIHIHLAGPGTVSTGDALILVHLHLEEGHPVEQRVECAKRAEPLAEGPVIALLSTVAASPRPFSRSSFFITLSDFLPPS